MNAAVGDDFHIAVGKQQINQHAVVVLGIPHPKLRKYFDGARSGAHPAPQRCNIQRGFDREADLSSMSGFTIANRLLDGPQRARRKRPPDRKVSDDKMFKDAL